VVVRGVYKDGFGVVWYVNGGSPIHETEHGSGGAGGIK